MQYKRTELYYKNKLSSPADTAGFVMEGEGAVSFPRGRMRLESLLGPELHQKANIVYWCDRPFPDHVEISWDFYPVYEPGLCIMFFSAMGQNGEGIFSPALARRNGDYEQYHSGDINALHVSYFRRNLGAVSFHVCNLRKSKGFNMVAQGADPLPPVSAAKPPYRICIVKSGADVEFNINDLNIFHWIDDGKSYGDVLGGGFIGFRQMSPMIAEYANLTVYRIEKQEGEKNETRHRFL